MPPQNFSVSWETFKNSLCEGLTTLQQNEECVDLTLAADGHFVKVHKVVMALASPYLKDLMSAMPCQHPVIFLNEVSSRILGLILEYIYTGETIVPIECMTQFAKVGKALRINGLDSLLAVKEEALKKTEGLNVSACPPQDPKTMTMQHCLPTKFSDKNSRLLQDTNTNNTVTQKPATQRSTAEMNQQILYYSTDDMDCESQEDFNVKSILEEHTDDNIIIKTDNEADNVIDKERLNNNLLYTISIRGCLQMILNRFMYNLEYTKNKGMRRWRCTEYRNKKCPAWLMTRNNVVVNRANFHNHPEQDKKILAKIEQEAVFTAIEEAEKLVAKSNKNEKDSVVESNNGEEEDHNKKNKKIVAKIEQEAVFTAIEEAEKLVAKSNKNEEDSVVESNNGEEEDHNSGIPGEWITGL